MVSEWVSPRTHVHHEFTPWNWGVPQRSTSGVISQKCWSPISWSSSEGSDQPSHPCPASLKPWQGSSMLEPSRVHEGWSICTWYSYKKEHWKLFISIHCQEASDKIRQNPLDFKVDSIDLSRLSARPCISAPGTSDVHPSCRWPSQDLKATKVPGIVLKHVVDLCLSTPHPKSHMFMIFYDLWKWNTTNWSQLVSCQGSGHAFHAWFTNWLVSFLVQSLGTVSISRSRTSWVSPLVFSQLLTCQVNKFGMAHTLPTQFALSSIRLALNYPKQRCHFWGARPHLQTHQQFPYYIPMISPSALVRSTIFRCLSHLSPCKIHCSQLGSPDIAWARSSVVPARQEALGTGAGLRICRIIPKYASTSIVARSYSIASYSPQ